ncbi:hypothetical protein [Paraglaciecola sp. L1A13]|nr:hypothetical protein [Paraglaciecola sp. L1A13]
MKAFDGASWAYLGDPQLHHVRTPKLPIRECLFDTTPLLLSS